MQANNTPTKPTILRDAQLLLLAIEQSVRKFPRYHKYTLGSELRAQALAINKLVMHALNQRDQRPRLVPQIAPAVEEFKIQLHIAKELQVLASFAEFEKLATLSMAIGRQSWRWKQKLQQLQPAG